MFLKYLFTINTLKHITLSKFVITPTCFGLSGPSSGSVMFLVLKLLVFYIWCCDGMRLGVQVMSACLVDVYVAGRVAIACVWVFRLCLRALLMCLLLVVLL